MFECYDAWLGCKIKTHLPGLASNVTPNQESELTGKLHKLFERLQGSSRSRMVGFYQERGESGHIPLKRCRHSYFGYTWANSRQEVHVKVRELIVNNFYRFQLLV